MATVADIVPAATVSWPDLSAYQVTLGVVDLEGGKRTLVFADESGRYGHIARNMGFSRTRWNGVWVRNDPRFEPAAFRAAFPRVALLRRSREEIHEQILDKIRVLVDRAKQEELPGVELVRDVATPGAPVAPPAGAAAPAVPAPAPASTGGELIDISPLIAEALPLGINADGEEVFTSPNGSRFARLTDYEGRVSIVREPGHLNASDEVLGRFLRGDSDGALAIAAQGFVRAMAEGRTARSDDFAQFFRAVTDRDLGGAAQDNGGAAAVAADPDMPRIAAAVDRARVQRLAAVAQDPSVEAFEAALRLHEAAQYYSVVQGDRMHPLPVGVAVQHIMSARPAGSAIDIVNAPFGEFANVTPALPGSDEERNEGEAAPPGLPVATIAVHRPTRLADALDLMGTKIVRGDQAELLQSLARRQNDGLSVFIIGGDGVAGRVGPESRRFLDTLATHYAIEGMIDLDGAMTGTPNAPPSRILVVGAKREVPGHGGLPPTFPAVTDYENLWVWTTRTAEALRKPGSVPVHERGAIGDDSTIVPNVFQAPYIPTSLLSEPQLMIPRNLASPTRRAMLRIMETTPHIDTWLGERLDLEPEELGEALSAEQADIVTMCLHRMESGLGFMVADQTGVGKGRALAAVMRSAKLRGQPIVFLTEKAELFTDIWRDIEDTGSADLFKNIFIINDDAQVFSSRNGEVVAKSAPREAVEQVMRSLKLPQADIVFATYSQFNRDPVKAIVNANVVDVDDLAKKQLSETAQHLAQRANSWRRAENKKELEAVSVEAFDILSDPTLIPKLPLAAVKTLWIGHALDEAMLVMDESHNASGEASQTNLNLAHGVMRAKDVVYSSATFARAERNMRIYRRLFPGSVDVEGLHETLKKGGEALQESLASMLAEDGALIRREHDLSAIKFLPRVDTTRQARNEKLADQLAEILAAMTMLTRESRQVTDAMSESMQEAFKKLHGKVTQEQLRKVGMVSRNSMGSQFYLTMQAFMAAIKADLAVEEAVTAMREGRKPVIVIEHTMESELNRCVDHALANGTARETPEGIVMPQPGFRAVLLRMLEKSLQVQLDGQELELSKRPEFATIVRDIEKLIHKFPDMPISTLDLLRQGMEQAGFKVAELSGRKRRLQYLGNGEVRVDIIPPKARKQARDRFNNGDADAMLLTRAGNAGISLHSSYRFVNTGQREMIELEVPEDVIARTQFFGRVNRKGQLSPPVIKTLSSGLPAEDRILALQNNKLRRMSANITANRDNAALTKDIADILNIVGNEVAYRFLELRPALGKKLDIELADRDESGNVKLFGDVYVAKLFSRLVMLPVKQQREIIKTIAEEFDALVDELNASGENPLKARFYDVHAKVVSSKVLEMTSLANSATEDGKPRRVSTFDSPVLMNGIEYTDHFEPTPPARVKKGIQEGIDAFVKKIEKNYGPTEALLARQDAGAFMTSLVDTIVDARDELLKTALPQRYPTVADALADPKSNNIVKQMDFKVNRLLDTLATLRVGSVVSFRDPETQYTVDNVVVVGLSVPSADEAHYAGRYTVKLARPGQRLFAPMALSTLLAADLRITQDAPDEKTFAAFARIKSGNFTVERNVLAGNLFRAAEMSLQTMVGTQALFSDEHGAAHRAVVLPLSADESSFKKMPLRIHDPALAVEFFQTVKEGKLHSLSLGTDMYSNIGSSDSRRGLTVKIKAGELILQVPGNQHWITWLRNNQGLMAVTGPFGGTRDALFAAIPVSETKALIDAVYKTGVTMYAHADSQASLVDTYTNATHNAEGKPLRFSPRDWFDRRLGGIADDLKDTKDLKPKDAMADLDGGAKKLRRVA